MPQSIKRSKSPSQALVQLYTTCTPTYLKHSYRYFRRFLRIYWTESFMMWSKMLFVPHHQLMLCQKCLQRNTLHHLLSNNRLISKIRVILQLVNSKLLQSKLVRCRRGVWWASQRRSRYMHARSQRKLLQFARVIWTWAPACSMHLLIHSACRNHKHLLTILVIRPTQR